MSALRTDFDQDVASNEEVAYIGDPFPRRKEVAGSCIEEVYAIDQVDDACRRFRSASVPGSDQRFATIGPIQICLVGVGMSQ